MHVCPGAEVASKREWEWKTDDDNNNIILKQYTFRDI